MLGASAELLEITNLAFLVRLSLVRAETGKMGEREQMHADRHAWKGGEGDPDKGEINMGNGDEGCVHRCCGEMQECGEYQNGKGGAGNVVKAEAAERYRKRRGDTDRYYTSKRDVEDEEEVDKGEERR